MPYVKKAKKPHTCNTPILGFFHTPRMGDIWKCWHCKQLWEHGAYSWHRITPLEAGLTSSSPVKPLTGPYDD